MNSENYHQTIGVHPTEANEPFKEYVPYKHSFGNPYDPDREFDFDEWNLKYNEKWALTDHFNGANDYLEDQ